MPPAFLRGRQQTGTDYPAELLDDDLWRGRRHVALGEDVQPAQLAWNRCTGTFSRVALRTHNVSGMGSWTSHAVVSLALKSSSVLSTSKRTASYLCMGDLG